MTSFWQTIERRMALWYAAKATFDMSRAVEYWSGIGRPLGLTKCDSVMPSSRGFAVHLVGKRLDAAGIVAGQAAGDVVHAMDQHHLEQIEAAIGLAGLDIELYRLGPGVADIHGHRLVETAGLDDDEAGEELLRAGGGAALIGVFLVQNLPGARIEDDDGGGMGDGDAIGADCAAWCRRCRRAWRSEAAR